jgi:hypothetical protein
MVDEDDGKGVASSDQWALPFISVNYVRNILEAFDDDASGFVTVKEVIDFIRSRPLNWRLVPGKPYPVQPAHINYSLPHWLAYWAIGDHHYLVGCSSFGLTVTRLADDLHELLREDRRDL